MHAQRELLARGLELSLGRRRQSTEQRARVVALRKHVADGLPVGNGLAHLVGRVHPLRLAQELHGAL